MRILLFAALASRNFCSRFSSGPTPAINNVNRRSVRIEKRFFEKGSSTPSIFSVYSDFVYDEPLDDSLFSTEPPPGYGVDQATVTFLSEADDDDSQDD